MSDNPGRLEGADHRPGPRVRLTAEGTVLRHRRSAEDGLAVDAEAALLALVADRVSLPVPSVVSVRTEQAVIELERMPGRPLLELTGTVPLPDAVRLGEQLGMFVAELADVPTYDVADLVPVDVPDHAELLDEAGDHYDVVRAELPPPTQRPLEAFLAAAPKLLTPEPVLTHQDLGAEHVFVTPTLTITGVIDWSDAALGDPAVDLGLVTRDLGLEAGKRAVAGYAARGLPSVDLLPRALFHARTRTLEDLAHGMTTGQASYWDNALRALGRLFPGPR